MTTTLRIATRKSPLALWQAEHVKSRLQALHDDLRVELVTMTTQGDKLLDSPLAKIGGQYVNNSFVSVEARSAGFTAGLMLDASGVPRLKASASAWSASSSTPRGPRAPSCT